MSPDALNNKFKLNNKWDSGRTCSSSSGSAARAVSGLAHPKYELRGKRALSTSRLPRPARPPAPRSPRLRAPRLAAPRSAAGADPRLKDAPGRVGHPAEQLLRDSYGQSLLVPFVSFWSGYRGVSGLVYLLYEFHVKAGPPIGAVAAGLLRPGTGANSLQRKDHLMLPWEPNNHEYVPQNWSVLKDLLVRIKLRHSLHTPPRRELRSGHCSYVRGQ